MASSLWHYVCMRNVARTTIILPRETLRRAKLRSVQRDQTLSEFITEAIEQALGPSDEPVVPELPIGKYRWGTATPLSRKDLYDQALRPKVPA